MNNAPDGPLPYYLLILTFVTGSVDAVSILGLGHVFVANMTGNIIFLSFATAGTPGFKVIPLICALLGFFCGAILIGRIANRITHRAKLLTIAATLKVAFAAIALIFALVLPLENIPIRELLIVLLASTLGIQNSVVRKLAVENFNTTTAVTITLAGIAADLFAGKQHRPRLYRRIQSVLMISIGAIVGAFLVRTVGIVPPLATIVVCYLAVSLLTLRHFHAETAWTTGR